MTGDLAQELGWPTQEQARLARVTAEPPGEQGLLVQAPAKRARSIAFMQSMNSQLSKKEDHPRPKLPVPVRLPLEGTHQPTNRPGWNGAPARREKAVSYGGQPISCTRKPISRSGETSPCTGVSVSPTGRANLTRRVGASLVGDGRPPAGSRLAGGGASPSCAGDGRTTRGSKAFSCERRPSSPGRSPSCSR